MDSPQCVIRENGYSPELFGFDDTIKSMQEAINNLDSKKRSNIAIVAEPFSGRSELLYKAADLCSERESKINLNGLVKDRIFLDTIKKYGDIVLVDNCHFLYSRKIGGFLMLDEFLNAVATSDKLFITTWNIYSWNYLRQIYPLEKIFPLKIELPKLAASDLKKMVMSACEWEMTFAEEEASREEKVIEISKIPLEIKPLNISLNVPIPKLDYSALKSRLPGKIGYAKEPEEISVEDKVFQRLKEYSEGNPGVAKAIWRISVPKAEGSIKPADIVKPQHKIDLKYGEAFVLFVLLCMEDLDGEELRDIAGPDVDINRLLFNLSSSELIFIQDGICSIRPEALHSIDNYTKSMRMVW